MVHLGGTLLLVSTVALGLCSPTIPIAPGVHMPMVNLGGVSSEPSNYTSWLALGGRGLDTALSYGDDIQREVAASIKGSTVPRDQIFLTTKVPCCPQPRVPYCENREFNGSVAESIARDVRLLGQPIDLLLLHWPCETLEQTITAYSALEHALDAGLTHAIGVSNFNASLLSAMLPRTKVKPAVNQCGHSVGAHNASHNPQDGGDDGTVQYCFEHGISYSAYSPLGGLSGLDVFKDPTVKKIAGAHQVSPAQVALRWLVQQNISVVTASNNPTYQSEDMDLFSFELSNEEMSTLAAL